MAVPLEVIVLLWQSKKSIAKAKKSKRRLTLQVSKMVETLVLIMFYSNNRDSFHNTIQFIFQHFPAGTIQFAAGICRHRRISNA
jgi:hypothetical protein